MPKQSILSSTVATLDVGKDAKGNNTYVLCDWWKCNSAELSNFAFVLCAVLTLSPNSCPPERLFSIFNATFDAYQMSSFGDYIELSMQSQYKKRDV